jgi:hypothetical protein
MRCRSWGALLRAVRADDMLIRYRSRMGDTRRRVRHGRRREREGRGLSLLQIRAHKAPKLMKVPRGVAMRW